MKLYRKKVDKMKKKMDVLLLCQFFYPEYVSSATLPYDTAIALKDSGLKVGVMCGYPNEYNLSGNVPKREIHNGINIRRIKYMQFKRTSFLGRIINYFSFTISVSLKFIKFKKYKTVIVYSNPPILPLIAVFAKKIFNTKVIFVSYDVYPEIAERTQAISKNSIISKIMKKVNNIVFKNVHKVIALSNEMKDFLLEYRSTLTEKQIEIIPNWYDDKINTNKNEISKDSRFLNAKKEDKFIVSYFGNLGIAQELDTIVDTIKEFKEDEDIHFMFAGHGNKMDLLKDIIKNENIKNVSIYSFLHGKDYEDALEVSNCYIVSLAKNLTGLAVPSKTYGYMMAGKPILAIIGEESDIAKDLINNDAGYVIPNRGVSIMVSAIEELKNNEEKQIIMGENCRKVYLSNYTKDICTMKYVEVITDVLGRNN